MKELFEKVIIRSADDMPKEKGGYDTDIGFINFNPEHINAEDNRIDNVEFWSDNIDWYLRPVEKATPMPEVTDEMIMTYLSERCECDSDEEYFTMTRLDAITMINQFLSQMTVPTREMPTPIANDVKSYEIEIGECGHEAPIEFMHYDSEGCGTCPDCIIEVLADRIKKKNVIIKRLNSRLTDQTKDEREGK